MSYIFLLNLPLLLSVCLSYEKKKHATVSLFPDFIEKLWLACKTKHIGLLPCIQYTFSVSIEDPVHKAEVDTAKLLNYP